MDIGYKFWQNPFWSWSFFAKVWNDKVWKQYIVKCYKSIFMYSTCLLYKVHKVTQSLLKQNNSEYKGNSHARGVSFTQLWWGRYSFYHSMGYFLHSTFCTSLHSVDVLKFTQRHASSIFTQCCCVKIYTTASELLCWCIKIYPTYTTFC